MKAQELEYIYPFTPPTPPFSYPPVLNRPPAIKHTPGILNYPDITWHTETNALWSKIRPLTYSTLSMYAALASTTFSCIIILTPWMYIYFQLTAMVPKGSRKGKGKVNARAKIPTSVINWCLSLDHDLLKRFISVHIRGLIRISIVCGI
jgi:hypothetical protein